MIGQLLPRWTAIGILCRQIDEVLLAEAAICLRARGHRLRQRHCNVSLLTGQNLRTVEVATIGNRIEMLSTESLLGLRSHVGKLCPIRADIRDLVRDNQMVLGVYSHLMATLAVVNRPILRQRATNCAQTLRIAGPLSFRKSAIVL